MPPSAELHGSGTGVGWDCCRHGNKVTDAAEAPECQCYAEDSEGMMDRQAVLCAHLDWVAMEGLWEGDLEI